MINLYSREEIGKIRASCRIVGQILNAIGPDLRPGVRTEEINRRIEELIRGEGAEPAFLGYRGYPAASCISVNEEVVHGIPGSRKLKGGDLVSVDVGVRKDGFCGDAARTYKVGYVGRDQERLFGITALALERGIEKARAGNRISDISAAIEDTVEAEGCSPVRDLVGHGIGRKMHEDPQVPNYRSGHAPDPLIRNGMVIAIEPMINLGSYEVETLADRWTVVTRDRKPSAHFEHTVAIVDGAAKVLTVGDD